MYCMGGGDYIFGANQAGKHACSLLNCISVTDDTDLINEQDKSIATGLLYMHTPSLTGAFVICLTSDLCTDGIENN